MAVEIDVVYEGDLRCVATHGPSKDKLATDAPQDNGGRGAAFSPTDLIATSLATCILTIMGLAAKRAGIDIDGARAHVTKEMTRSGVRRIAELRVTVAIPRWNQLSPRDRGMLEGAAAACPVKQSLHPDVIVAVSFTGCD
jgi:putative redox protein